MNKFSLYIIFTFLLSIFANAVDVISYKHSAHSVLSNTNISTLTKDNQGFIWIATQNEIARFDGNSYLGIGSEINKQIFSKNNIIQSLYFIQPDQLWICTHNGIFIYNIQYHTLKQVEAVVGIRVNSLLIESGIVYANTVQGILSINPNDLKSHLIYPYKWPVSKVANTSMAFDKAGRTYLFANKHLMRTAPISELMKNAKSGKSNSTEILLVTENPKRMQIDPYDNIWIWDRETLMQARLSNGKLENVKNSEIEITALLFDKNLTLLCNRGKENIILTHDEQGHTIHRETFLVEQQFDDMSNTTNYFYTDERRNFWLGTRNGLFMFPYGEKKYFINFRNDINDRNTLSHSTTSSVLIENRNTTWVGTAYGLSRINFSGNAESKYNIERIIDNRSIVNHVLDNKIEQVVIDGNGMMWQGTKGGVKIYNLKNNSYLTIPELEKLFENCSFVRSLYADKNKNIWIGFENGGVFFYNHKTRDIRKVEPDSVKNVNCQTITGDNQGVIWIGTRDHGVWKVTNPNGDENFSIKQYIINDAAYQETLWVTFVYNDNYNNLWAGTSRGLYKYSYENDNFIYMSLDLAENQRYISGVISDNRGNLWIALLTGIYKYNISEGTGNLITLYDRIFTRKGFVFSSSIDSDGYIYMTGINGLTIFNPNDIVTDTTHYEVHFTDFKVNNQSFGSENYPNKTDINYTSSLTLKHKNNQFSFAFSALVYTNRENIRYAYMLDGVDDDWIYVGSEERYISYSNLPAGRYELKIRSTNSNGIWQDNIRTLKIRIKPPIWQTWYFYLLYVALFLGLLYWIFHFWEIRRSLKEQTELEDRKLKIYTDLSHSIKTPLMLLQSSLHSLIDKFGDMPDDEKKYMLATMDKNSNRLLLLVDQIGQFRKVSKKKAVLHLVESDFILFARGVYENFRDLFDSKNITFNFSTNIDRLKLTFDPEKIEIILLNLLSNTYKFTPMGGKVDFICNVDSAKHAVRVEINDSGIGIDKDYQEQVFERFFTIPHSGVKAQGLGVGLSLAKEFVELHKSKINLQSSDLGTKMSFDLLLGNSHFDDAEVEKIDETHPEFAYVDSYIDSELLELKKDEPLLKNAPLVYLIDDDLQTNQFIRNIFSPEIQVKPFQNQADLWDELDHEKVKLIISNVVFNGEKEGFELCEKIKISPQTNTIPFVFITSYSGDEFKKTAYELGADAYITKPFDVNYLKKRVLLLIESKEKIRANAKREIISQPKQVTIQSADDKFLAKAMTVIEKHLAESEFSVELFAGSMHMSTSMLYRKIKNLTNLSPNELIRSVRLKRASQLLENKSYSVSEVAEMVGFVDIRYFSTCFKKEFGVPPSQYSQSGLLEKSE